MKRFTSISLIMLVVLAGIPVILNSQVSPRTRESFNENWKFIKYFNASDEATTVNREPDRTDRRHPSMTVPGELLICRTTGR